MIGKATIVPVKSLDELRKSTGKFINSQPIGELSDMSSPLLFLGRKKTQKVDHYCFLRMGSPEDPDGNNSSDRFKVEVLKISPTYLYFSDEGVMAYEENSPESGWTSINASMRDERYRKVFEAITNW